MSKLSQTEVSGNHSHTFCSNHPSAPPLAKVKSLPLLAVLIIGAATAFFFYSRGVDTAGASAQATTAADPRIVSEAEMESYAPLELTEIYVTPVGPMGFELTEKARLLADRKVRVKGFMVRYPHPDPKLFIFSSAPMFLDFGEYRLADSLPPHAIHVITEVPEGKAYNYYKPEIILLGTIEYGPRTELDGRVSHIRLHLDKALDAETRSELDLAASLALQRERLFNLERLKQ